MAFCKFSPSYQGENKTMVDNILIRDFLPTAPDLCVKAYILGLSMCGNADDMDNSLSYFANVLKVCEDDVVSLFKYWEDQGLIQVLSTDPVEVRYLPVVARSAGMKRFKADKYMDFNIQVQELFSGRMVMPNEYIEFYNLIEKHHIQESALLAIIKYCVEFKGFNLSPNYCITVARDWEREGIHTLEQVQSKIEELGIIDDKMNMILTAIGTKRRVQIEDKDLLNKWLNSYGFDLSVIIFVIKIIKNKKKHIDISILDEILKKYYELKLLSIPEIENYENELDNLYQVAMIVNKELGIFYEDLSKEIDTYVIQWLNMGYDIEMLKLVADNCFKSSVRTLEGFNNVIMKLFKLGIVNTESYMQYLNDNFALDEKIKQVLNGLKLARNVNNMDRNFYHVWTEDWGFGHDVIMYATELSRDKSNAVHYLNKILSNWNSQGVKTIDKARATKVEETASQTFVHNTYTKEQISSIITGLDEVEV